MTTPTLPEITDATRREFLALLGAAGLLTGCGGSAEPPTTEPDTLTVEHAGGTTEVPVGAERIVAVDGYVDLQNMLALGVSPVLAGVDPRLLDGGFLNGRLDDVDEIGDRLLENLEQIAAARPDLILSGEYDTERYAALSGIAPTVLLDRDLPVDDHLRLIGRALGRESQADEVIAAYSRRLDEVATVVDGTELATATVGCLDLVFGGGTVRVYDADSYGGRTLTAAGVDGLVESQGESAGLGFGADISVERLDVLQPADALVVLVYNLSLSEGEASLEDSPLWQTLPAVAAGRVFRVDGDVWYQDTALSRTARLDDIERIAGEYRR